MGIHAGLALSPRRASRPLLFATRSSLLAAVLVTLIGAFVAGCGNSPGPTPVIGATATEIVTQETNDRLLALPFKKDADGPALRAFLAATAASTSRDELKTAWAAQPSLKDKAPTFLDDVFRMSEGEQKWPKPPSPDAEPGKIAAASVAGVRAGVEKFLK